MSLRRHEEESSQAVTSCTVFDLCSSGQLGFFAWRVERSRVAVLSRRTWAQSQKGCTSAFGAMAVGEATRSPWARIAWMPRLVAKRVLPVPGPQSDGGSAKNFTPSRVQA